MTNPDDILARQLADEWAIKRGFMSIEHFQHTNFAGASLKLRGKWLKFPSLSPTLVDNGDENTIASEAGSVVGA